MEDCRESDGALGLKSHFCRLHFDLDGGGILGIYHRPLSSRRLACPHQPGPGLARTRDRCRLRLFRIAATALAERKDAAFLIGEHRGLASCWRITREILSPTHTGR